MLNTYLTLTRGLLQLPNAPQTLYTDANLTTYINVARGQLAGEGHCIRRIGVLNTAISQVSYNFSSIVSTVEGDGLSADPAVAGIIHVRDCFYQVASGWAWMRPRDFPWYRLYHFNNPVPQPGAPTLWAQHGQGSSGAGAITGVGGGTISSGSLWIDPAPDLIYALNMDVVCYPAALAQDSDPEALPYLWTDAVPYYAAYMALLSAQTSERMQAGERYFQIYQQFVQRARQAATPEINAYLYPQQPDPAMANKFGSGGGGR